MSGGKNIKHRIRNKFLVLIILTVIVSAGIWFGYGYYNETIYKPVSPSSEAKTVDIEISRSNVRDIHEILYNKGMIRDKNTFRLYLRLSGFSNKLKAGKYEFSSDMNVPEIINIMVNGKTKKDTIKVTIPEGFTTADIAALLESKGLFSKEDFLKAAENSNLDYDFLKSLPERSGKLEGYLFPDTYEFAKNTTPEQVIDRLVGRFDFMFDESMKNKAKDMKMSIDQIVTIASMIEKEAKVESERPIISAVIYNRLKSGMKLQIDATVQYALGQWNDKVYTKDTLVNSPYNTYVVSGLPIGPISNPGKASLMAALNPEKVDYLYYVAKKDGSGSHAFTVTYQDFLNEKHKNQ
jgi:UPF0755 protein